MAALINLQKRVAGHLEEICKMFTQRPKITIVIRTPWLDEAGKDGDVVLTDDDFDMAIAAINRLRGRKPITQREAAAEHMQERNAKGWEL
jgi:hypothetical protein